MPNPEEKQKEGTKSEQQHPDSLIGRWHDFFNENGRVIKRHRWLFLEVVFSVCSVTGVSVFWAVGQMYQAQIAGKDAYIELLKAQLENSSGAASVKPPTIKERTLSEDLRLRLTYALAGGPKGNVDLINQTADDLGWDLREQLEQIFIAAGFTLNPDEDAEYGMRRPAYPGGIGLLVSDLSSPPPHLKSIKAAFESIGFAAPVLKQEGVSADHVLVEIARSR
jgi:hypothetical protein